MHYLPDVAVFALVLLVLFVTSATIPFPESKNRVSPHDLLLGVAASLGVWSLAIWIFGQWKLAHLSVYAAVLAMLLVMGALGVDKGRRALAHFQAIMRFFRGLRGVELALVLYLFAIFALTFVLNLAPPNGADYDSLMYHLAAPAQYARGGRIRELGYDHHTYFPFSMEMLYLLGLQLRGAVLAKMFHWLMLVLSCGALVAIGRRHLTRRAGLWAAVLFASLPMAQSEATTAYADLGLTAFVLAAFLCFSNWLQTRDENANADSHHASADSHYASADSHYASADSRAANATIENDKSGVDKAAKSGRARSSREIKEPEDEARGVAWANDARARDGRWLVWSGVFCGFCLGVKYLGALTLGWLLMWAIVRMARDRSFQPKPLLLFCAWAIILGGGWYARNWMETGNPVFPFAYGVFGGRGWNADMAAAYSADQAKYGFGRGVSDWFWMPWRVSMSPLNLGVLPPHQVVGLPFWPLSSEPLQGAAHSGTFEVPVVDMLVQSVVGPALLALGAPLVFVRRKPRIIRFIGWSFAFFAVFWAATSQQIRYLLPAFALLCVACGWGAEKYLGRGASLKWTCAVGLGLWLLFSPAFTLWKARPLLPVIAGAISPQEYLARTTPGYLAMRRASIETPPNSRFAIYGEARCFYLDRDYFWADDPHNNLIDYARIKTGADFVAALKQQGATHILQNKSGPPPQMQQAIANGQLKLLFEERGYRVYEITGGSATQ